MQWGMWYQISRGKSLTKVYSSTLLVLRVGGGGHTSRKMRYIKLERPLTMNVLCPDVGSAVDEDAASELVIGLTSNEQRRRSVHVPPV